MEATQILKTRVTWETKARVLAITRDELLTEAVWLRRLVAKALREQASAAPSRPGAERNCEPVTPVRMRCPKNSGGVARLYLRLRTEDRLLLRERASARGMASATYVSVFIRSHLRALTPLPKDELAVLKRAVGELGAVGRNLNQITRAANQGVRIPGPGRDEFKAILKICEALRDHTKELIKANAASWVSGYAESTS
jgi:hypothetical protein